MLKINEPIRIVCKQDDEYEFMVTRESKKINGNEEIFEFISYLRNSKVFEKDIVEKYTDENRITNKEDYYECLNEFIKNRIILSI